MVHVSIPGISKDMDTQQEGAIVDHRGMLLPRGFPSNGLDHILFTNQIDIPAIIEEYFLQYYPRWDCVAPRWQWQNRLLTTALQVGAFLWHISHSLMGFSSEQMELILL